MIEIDQAVGWWDNTSRFDSIIEKCKKKGWTGNDSGWLSGRSDIEGHLAHKGPGDAWTFFGHSRRAPDGGLAGLLAWVPFFAIRGGGNDVITAEDICKAMNKGNGPPSIIVLIACESAKMLDALVKCCAKIVVGFTEKVPVMKAGIVGEAFWEALLDGKTLAEAVAAANAALSGWNPDNTEMIFRAKPGIKAPGNLTLDQIFKLREKTDADGNGTGEYKVIE